MTAPHDVGYFRTISGILKICCLLCSFVGFLCIVCSSVRVQNIRGCFYISVAVFGFCCTVFMLLARFFQVWERQFHRFNAVKYETYLHAFLAFQFFAASASAVTLDVASYSAAAFFGFLAFGFYSHDAFLGYQLSRQCHVATQTQNAI